MYDEFKVVRKPEFKFGPLDGLSSIMSILFILFLISFFKSISLFGSIRKQFSKRKNAYQKHKSNGVSEGFFSKFFAKKNSKRSALQQDEAIVTTNGEHQSSPHHHVDCLDQIANNTNNYMMSPLSCEDVNLVTKKNSIFIEQLNQLNFLDKMKFFGEKLEKSIESRFTR